VLNIAIYLPASVSDWCDSCKVCLQVSLSADGQAARPEMHIIVDELADYHSLLLGSYKEKQTKTCCLYTQLWVGRASPTLAS
jgi:hypothetical protein